MPQALLVKKKKNTRLVHWLGMWEVLPLYIHGMRLDMDNLFYGSVGQKKVSFTYISISFFWRVMVVHSFCAGAVWYSSALS